jgi:hypothetical protein
MFHHLLNMFFSLYILELQLFECRLSLVDTRELVKLQKQCLADESNQQEACSARPTTHPRKANKMYPVVKMYFPPSIIIIFIYDLQLYICRHQLFYLICL